MTTCPNCERESHKIAATPKTIFFLLVEGWGIISLLLVILSIPPEARRAKEPLGFEHWLYPILETPLVSWLIIAGVLLGLLAFIYEGWQKIIARNYQHRCVTCGYAWNQD